MMAKFEYPIPLYEGFKVTSNHFILSLNLENLIVHSCLVQINYGDCKVSQWNRRRQH